MPLALFVALVLAGSGCVLDCEEPVVRSRTLAEEERSLFNATGGPLPGTCARVCGLLDGGFIAAGNDAGPIGGGEQWQCSASGNTLTCTFRFVCE
jgi:hypothetical protein